MCARANRPSFRGITKDDAVRELRKLGWRYAFKNSLIDPGKDPERVEVCPACVKARAPQSLLQTR